MTIAVVEDDSSIAEAPIENCHGPVELSKLPCKEPTFKAEAEVAVGTVKFALVVLAIVFAMVVVQTVHVARLTQELSDFKGVLAEKLSGFHSVMEDVSKDTSWYNAEMLQERSAAGRVHACRELTTKPAEFVRLNSDYRELWEQTMVTMHQHDVECADNEHLVSWQLHWNPRAGGKFVKEEFQLLNVLVDEISYDYRCCKI
jgi:hypothetical protein